MTRRIVIVAAVAAVVIISVAYHRARERERQRAPIVIPLPSLPPPPGIPEPLIEATRSGLEYLARKAEEYERQRAQQIARLDQQVAKIQGLIERNQLDQAEVLLVDVHWLPVEPHAKSELVFGRTYDDKRTALERAIYDRRKR